MKQRSRIEFAKMLDWLEGRLPEEEALTLTAQLAAADEGTLADLAWLRNFLEVSQKLKLVPPPPELRPVLRRRFAGYFGERRPPNIIGRLAATLTYDSHTQLASAGFRSVDLAGSQRQLVFSTHIAEIVLNIHTRPQDQRLNLIGQVFSSEEGLSQGFSVQLLRGVEEVGLTTTDDLGEFAFEGFPAGTYELVLSMDRFEVWIPSIQLQS